MRLGLNMGYSGSALRINVPLVQEADRLGFRRSLSLAYFILSVSYFLLGSLGSPWLSPVRNAVPLWLLVG